MKQQDLKLVANTVIGSISKSKSGWKNINNISAWQKKQRQNEDKHRSP